MAQISAEIIEALKPSLGGQVVVVSVMPKEDGTIRWVDHPGVYGTLANARGAITRTAGYRRDVVSAYHAVYEYDVEESAFVLVEFVEAGTHKDDLPWRTKKKK